MTGQVVSLFIGGIETSSSILSSVLYELGRNQDVQERLYEEIVEVFDRHVKKVTYEALQEMTYLDRVVHGRSALIKNECMTSVYTYVCVLLSTRIPTSESCYIANE